MRLLACWISFRQNWSRLAKAELELPEQPLALAHAQFHSVGLSNPSREGLAIPEIDPHSRIAGPCAQHAIDFFYLLWAQSARTPRAFALRHAGHPPLPVSMNPILD